MPYWRLSGFYLFYFALVGALIPYWSLYLKDLGFSARDIGMLMALVMATKIISPNVWGWVADRTGKRMMIVRLGCLLAAVAFAGVFLGDDYWWLVLVMLVFSFFWNATLPQFEATTFNYLGKESHRYSGIRLWGSVGFIVAVAALGPVLDVQGAAILPIIIMVLFVGMWISSLLVPEQAAQHLSLSHEPLRKVLRRPEVMALLVVCFLLQVSHGPYYTFYTIYLEDHGYSRSVIGQLWALGVLAEVGVFMLMHRWVRRFGLRNLLLASLALTVVRWILIGQFPELSAVMIFAQVLHAASFGIYHAVAIQLIHRNFTGKNQGRGQALYSSLSFGAGGAVGSFASGLGWDTIGPANVYWLAALMSLAAFIVAALWIRPERE
ncbi:MAG: MFS transporter [Ectothiorhodospiraceae bacterium]|nr:MFS transporter [Ectothiorhodospiraceae bacterium]MBN4053109.1 MFS transporter [Gammaproteobacteria bacterium AH-315-K14]